MAKTNIFRHQHYRSLLHAEIDAWHSTNSKYSLRFLSIKMDSSESHLKLILSGARRLTPEKAGLLAKALRFDVVERNYLMTLCLLEQCKVPELKKSLADMLEDFRNQRLSYVEGHTFLSVFSNSLAWEIYSLVGVSGFSKKLRPDQIKRCWQQLIAIGAVIESDGKCTALDAVIQHTDAVKDAYRAALNRALTFLDETSLDETSYFDSFCLILDADEFAEIKGLIEATKQKIAVIASRKSNKSLIAFYNANIFPVSGEVNDN